jgi:Ca2+-binding RTX toxin-like protein
MSIITLRWSLALGSAALLVAAGLSLAAATPAGAATPICNGEPATIVGTEGRDDIEGTSGRDVIVGLAGNDEIDGNGGNDVIPEPAGQVAWEASVTAADGTEYTVLLSAAGDVLDVRRS